MADDSTNDNTNLQPDPQETLDANGGTPDVTPSALTGGSTVPDVSSPAVMPNPQSPGSPEEQDMDTQTSGGQNATSGAADGAQGGSGSMWQRILQGALAGLAGQQQHGRSSVANGIIGGAKGAEVVQQQQQENDRANADLQSNIKFRNLQSAQMLATAARQDKELALSTQEHNDAHDANARETIDWLQSHGVDGDIIPNTQAATTNTLQNASAASPDGVNVPPGLVHGSNFVFIPKNDSEDVNSEYRQVSDLSAAMGMPVPSQSQFQNISSDKRDSLRDGLLQMARGNDRTGALIPAAQLPQQITQAKSALAAYQSSPTADPATVKLMQARIANMQQQSDDVDKHLAKQENEKALAKNQAKTANANEAKTPATPDAFGVTSSLDQKQYNSRYNTFSKAYVQPLTKADQQLAQFANIQSDFDKTGNLTGAETVVGLFNAIGISASPLKGMGFRINNNTIEEHANARGLGQSLYQRLLSLKSGDVVTPQQLRDYASIATQARESQYNSAIDEARRQQLPVDFLPKGNGSQIDASTARMYLRAAGGDPAKARAAANASGWKMGQ